MAVVILTDFIVQRFCCIQIAPSHTSNKSYINSLLLSTFSEVLTRLFLKMFLFRT